MWVITLMYIPLQHLSSLLIFVALFSNFCSTGVRCLMHKALTNGTPKPDLTIYDTWVSIHCSKNLIIFRSTILKFAVYLSGFLVKVLLCVSSYSE